MEKRVASRKERLQFENMLIKDKQNTHSNDTNFAGEYSRNSCQEKSSNQNEITTQVNLNFQKQKSVNYSKKITKRDVIWEEKRSKRIYQNNESKYSNSQNIRNNQKNNNNYNKQQYNKRDEQTFVKDFSQLEINNNQKEISTRGITPGINRIVSQQNQMPPSRLQNNYRGETPKQEILSRDIISYPQPNNQAQQTVSKGYTPSHKDEIRGVTPYNDPGQYSSQKSYNSTTNQQSNFNQRENVPMLSRGITPMQNQFGGGNKSITPMGDYNSNVRGNFTPQPHNVNQRNIVTPVQNNYNDYGVNSIDSNRFNTGQVNTRGITPYSNTYNSQIDYRGNINTPQQNNNNLNFRQNYNQTPSSNRGITPQSNYNYNGQQQNSGYRSNITTPLYQQNKQISTPYSNPITHQQNPGTKVGIGYGTSQNYNNEIQNENYNRENFSRRSSKPFNTSDLQGLQTPGPNSQNNFVERNNQKFVYNNY